MVVTDVQDYIAAGQFRAGDQLIEAQNVSRPGTILIFLEPLYQDGLIDVPPGSTCIANAYTSNHELLKSKDIGIVQVARAARRRHRRPRARDDPAHPGAAAAHPDPGVLRALTRPPTRQSPPRLFVCQDQLPACAAHGQGAVDP